MAWMDIVPPETLLPSAVLPTGMGQRWRAGTPAASELRAHLACTWVWLCRGRLVTGAKPGARRGCRCEEHHEILPVFTEAAPWFRNPAAHFQPLPAGVTARAEEGEGRAGVPSPP